MNLHGLRVLTNSELSCRRRCPREHYFAFELGCRPVDAEEQEPLRFGSLFHAGMEPWWEGKGLAAAIAAAEPGAIDEYEAAKARVLLRGYDARWAGDAHLYEVVAVEQEFRAPLVNPETGATSRTFCLGGKIDAQLSRRIVEHKTTSEEIGPGSKYWRKLVLNTQISTYYEGSRSLGFEVDECVYDVVRKPALRPKQVPLTCDDGFKIVLDAAGARVWTKDGKKPRETADTAQGWVLQTRIETVEEYEDRLTEEVASDPDRYFQRGTVVRLEADEIEAQRDAWQQATGIREDARAGVHPRNPDACERFGRLCAYFDVCTGVTTIDDAARFERVANVHPELTAEPLAAE